jgi:hypothetical protein
MAWHRMGWQEFFGRKSLKSASRLDSAFWTFYLSGVPVASRTWGLSVGSFVLVISSVQFCKSQRKAAAYRQEQIASGGPAVKRGTMQS